MTAASNVPPLEIDCHQLKSRMDAAEDLLLIDCREADEHAVVLEHAAKHVARVVRVVHDEYFCIHIDSRIAAAIRPSGTDWSLRPDSMTDRGIP